MHDFSFTVKHAEKQKWVRLESLLQPEWPWSVFVSLIMTHYTHLEFKLCRIVTSRVKMHVSLVKFHTATGLDTATLLWMKMNQRFLVRHNLCSDSDEICRWDRESSATEVRGGHCELISHLSLFQWNISRSPSSWSVDYWNLIIS